MRLSRAAPRFTIEPSRVGMALPGLRSRAVLPAHPAASPVHPASCHAPARLAFTRPRDPAAGRRRARGRRPRPRRFLRVARHRRPGPVADRPGRRDAAPRLHQPCRHALDGVRHRSRAPAARLQRRLARRRLARARRRRRLAAGRGLAGRRGGDDGFAGISRPPHPPVAARDGRMGAAAADDDRRDARRLPRPRATTAGTTRPACSPSRWARRGRRACRASSSWRGSASRALKPTVRCWISTPASPSRQRSACSSTSWCRAAWRAARRRRCAAG